MTVTTRTVMLSGMAPWACGEIHLGLIGRRVRHAQGGAVHHESAWAAARTHRRDEMPVNPDEQADRYADPRLAIRRSAWRADRLAMSAEKRLHGSHTMSARAVGEHLTKKRPEHHRQRKRTVSEAWDLFQQSHGKQIPEEILGLTQTKRTEINSFAQHCRTGPNRPPVIKFSVSEWKHRPYGSH
ncbi:MAG: hypothetical protein RLZZ245_2660 [Verrucomicrobiota bacterium]